MDIKNHESLRRIRMAHPKYMHEALFAAFLNGYIVGIREEKHRRSEEDRLLGLAGLSRQAFLKYQPKEEE